MPQGSQTKWVLVTGATRGIGRAICERLQGAGYGVVGLARSADETFPGKLFSADISDQRSTAAALAAITAEYEIGHLVNNAGMGSLQHLQDLDFDQLRAMVEINLRAAAQCAQACTPRMIARKQGRIVNITSRALLGRVGTSFYSACKAGLGAMTRCWALELAEHGITVNAVAPGFIDTELMRSNNPPGTPMGDAVRKVTPMGRPGNPDEAAGAVEYFLSPSASFTTGQTLFVCGGWSVGVA